MVPPGYDNIPKPWNITNRMDTILGIVITVLFISKFNKILISEGMVLSNEPGYYKKGHFGIRIENLVYVKKVNKKLIFQNLTMAPIEKDLINFKLISKSERNYLFRYHLEVYSKISKYLNKNERKWLASFI